MEGSKKEVLFLVCVCLSDAQNRQRHVVEVEELYNTWKKPSISISVAVTLLFFFLCTLFFPTVTLQPMYALGIYWHYTLFEMLFAFAHDIHFSMQLLQIQSSKPL